eukprot:Sdes_comp19294_c0_seq1m10348
MFLQDIFHSFEELVHSEFSSPYSSHQMFYYIFVLHSLWFTLLWLCIKPLRNAGLVDLGWPTGFTAIAVFYLCKGEGVFVRRFFLACMQIFCGLRFVLGWFVRTIQYGEDLRWQLWRERWKQRKGFFGVRNEALNFFCFYHAQNFTNIFVFSIPFRFVVQNQSPHLTLLEKASSLLWLASFLLENIADYQLACHKTNPLMKGKTLNTGLWKYSRHPNYFFEFMIWTSYALYSLDSIVVPADLFSLLVVPATAYWFLVYFTGVPMTEEMARITRGNEYKLYQKTTNMFFPWFPASLHVSKSKIS